jgi:hypothetical protein
MRTLSSLITKTTEIQREYFFTSFQFTLPTQNSDADNQKMKLGETSQRFGMAELTESISLALLPLSRL